MNAEIGEDAVDAELADTERAHREWTDSLSAETRSHVYCIRVDISNRNNLTGAIQRRWQLLEAQLEGHPIPTWLREGVSP